MRPIATAALLTLTAAPPALGQGIDCANASAQTALNACAAQAYEFADAELNDAYEGALFAAGVVDGDGARGLQASLREAQRLWIPFRDAACEAEASIHEGGSMQPMVQSDCLARVTQARSQDLFAFTDAIGLGTRTP